jgi:predicted transcriptional regulator
MAERSPADRLPLTLSLSPELARRLAQAAEAQKRPAAAVVLDLLDKYLPRADAGGKRGKIPYT